MAIIGKPSIDLIEKWMVTVKHQTQRPFVWLAWGSVLGILLGNAGEKIAWIALMLLACLLLALFCYVKWAKGGYGLLLLISCLIFFVRFVTVDGSNVSQLDQLVNEGETYRVTGKIVSYPRIDGDRVIFDYQLDQLNSERGVALLEDERIRVTVRLLEENDQAKAKLLLLDDQIQADVRLIKPQPARNPGGFDQKRFLYQQRIHWLGEVDAINHIELLQRVRWNVFRFIHQMRHQIADQITTIYSPPYDGYIRGMVLGERDQLNPGVEESYAAFGITHVLSISGLHISILVSIGFFLFKSLGLPREKAALILLLLIPCYVLLTGAEPPVVRAGIMAGLLLLAILLNRWKDALSFLAIACLVQLAWNPYLLFTASFQLTFVITAALIVGVSPLVKKGAGIEDRLKQSVAAALVAQFSSFPIVVYFFHEFSFLSWLANLFFVPFLSMVVLPGSIVAIGISFPHPEWGKLMATLTVHVIQGVHQGMEWLAPLFYPVPNFRPPSFIWLVIYSGAALYLWFSLIQERRQRVLHRVMASSLFVGTLLWAAFPPAGGYETRVTFLDVGQGDCMVIETVKGKTIVIDGGGTLPGNKAKWAMRRDPFEVGKHVVVPFLKVRGVDQIDTLVITHGDADHIGGLRAVASRFPIKQVIRNAYPPQSRFEEELMAQFVRQQVPINIVPYGKVHAIEEGIFWQFLHPPTDMRTVASDASNHQSVVILLTIYGHRLLLPGDIEQEAEDVLLQQWDLPAVDVLKVAHHGSKTSTQEHWLRQIEPKEAILSVGRKNRYGHPSQEVIQRLQRHHVRIWRTDQQGAITIYFSPDHYRIEPMIPS